MLRETWIALSVAMNAVVIAAIAWFSLGGGMRLLVARFITPAHEQRVSHFDAFAIAAGDVVFLGDSITEAVAGKKFSPALARETAELAALRSPAGLR